MFLFPSSSFSATVSYKNCFTFYLLGHVIFTLVEEFKLANVIILCTNKTTRKLRMYSHFKIN